MIEVRRSIPLKEIFKEENQEDPFYRLLLEWHASGASGGKDGRGAATSYNWMTDELELLTGFRERNFHWYVNSDEPDRYHLNEMPSEQMFRDYLRGKVLLNSDLGKFEPLLETNPTV